jgi:hypothetical protein
MLMSDERRSSGLGARRITAAFSSRSSTTVTPPVVRPVSSARRPGVIGPSISSRLMNCRSVGFIFMRSAMRWLKSTEWATMRRSAVNMEPTSAARLFPVDIASLFLIE